MDLKPPSGPQGPNGGKEKEGLYDSLDVPLKRFIAADAPWSRATSTASAARPTASWTSRTSSAGNAART
jgi:hypothetical protein